MRILALLLVLASTALAQKVGDNQVAGFVTAGRGQLTGRVLDRANKPVANAQVHVVPAGGKETVVKTGADGRYRVELTGGEYTMVFVHGDYQIEGQAAVASHEGDDEAIEIREAIRPAVAPVPKGNALAIPPYSATAIDRDAWVRAWLLLDVDERGLVTRVKLLDRPGYDLDAIAIREAFALKFEPARDRVNRSTRALVVWNFEWPAYWWLRKQTHDLRRMPPEALEVPCFGSGPTHSRYRDCSKPDIAASVTVPWRDKH